MASVAALQAHYEEVIGQTTVLPMSTLPKCFAISGQALRAVLSSSQAAALVQQAAASMQQCQVCSRSTDPLQLLTVTRLDLVNRTACITAGQLACSMCRAASAPTLLLQMGLPFMGSEDYERSDQLQQLFLHFAAVNGAPASITGNPEALAVWVQELACRAYSLQVVASSIKGWKLLGPDGEPVQLGSQSSVLRLVQQLLSAGDAVPADNRGTAAKTAAAASAKGKSKLSSSSRAAKSGLQGALVSKHKRKRKLEAAHVVQQQQQQPSRPADTPGSSMARRTSLAQQQSTAPATSLPAANAQTGRRQQQQLVGQPGSNGKKPKLGKKAKAATSDGQLAGC